MTALIVSRGSVASARYTALFLLARVTFVVVVLDHFCNNVTDVKKKLSLA